MAVIEVLTVTGVTPLSVLDRVMSAAEVALAEAGAVRVWIVQTDDGLTVMAEMPGG